MFRGGLQITGGGGGGGGGGENKNILSCIFKKDLIIEGDIFYELERSYTHPGMISLEYPKFLEQQFLRTAKNECLGRYKSSNSICYHDFIMLVSRTKYFNTFALVCGLLIHVEHQKT